MFDLKTIVRPSVLALKPYSSARDEFTGKTGVFLDANENPYGHLNRYPDPHQAVLKHKLAALKSVSETCIFVGNGSDEVIDLTFRIFCEPGHDKALTFSPTYGMYGVSAAVNNVDVVTIPLKDNFQIDLHQVTHVLDDPKLKLIFICSPNNPTGNAIHSDTIAAILEQFSGIVLIDEAYIDFSTSESWVHQLKNYPNLIVSQTFSKAWGLAAARVGVAYAHKEVIGLFNKIKPPYNVSALNQNAAVDALSDWETFEENRLLILQQKEILIRDLKRIDLVKKVYPSDANFVLVEVSEANTIYNTLVAKKVIIRNRNNVVKNCIRISVGTSEENAQLLRELQTIVM